ncbi:DUF4386 domain-containing protein [Georgenia sp. SYP-B2076]|uniref:DUF4386 domain-containing protein n=1 Tax=Georgenia sp. SYP-B2076 TaxID=2495881 RepID=UPI001F0C8BE1|nr:DUF4386 domain-containing protein [Georgenia sp. SYP-B2076]
MTATALSTPTRQRAPMSSLRKTALLAGALYVLTFVSIPTLALYGAVKGPSYITGPGPDTAALLGGALEMVVALAGIGTAVVLFPVVKRQNEGVALALVGTRVLEAATIFAGVASLMTIVTLRQAGAGAEAAVTAQALVAQYDWLFRLGQGTIPAANALLLGSLLYRSGLVPRILPLLGFVGAPLLIVSNVGTVLGLWGQVSALTALAAVPIALWEFSLGVYLIVKGFKPSPITAGLATPRSAVSRGDVA